jgi:hypothetical protein
MAGRRQRVAKPGEPACGVHGCRRPAGIGTATPGHGPCLRHGGARYDTAPIRASAPAAPAPLAIELTPPDPHVPRPLPPLNGVHPGEDPFPLLRAVLALARHAQADFREAWPVALEAALSYRAPDEQDAWSKALKGTRTAWSDAYQGRPSRMRELEPA